MRTDSRLEKKLASYALAGGAALAMSGVAQAGTVTTWVDENVTGAAVIDAFGVPEFIIFVNPGNQAVHIIPLPGNAVVGVSESTGGPSWYDASALVNGTSVGASNQWITSEAKLSDSGYYKAGWSAGTNAYLGLQFSGADGAHYGWAQGTIGPNAGSFHLVQWAYESNPGVSATIATPEPSSLALLGLGVVGLLAWRKRNRR